MTDHAREITQLLLRLRSDDPPVDPEVEAAVASELHTKDAARVVAELCRVLTIRSWITVARSHRCYLRYDFVAAIPHVRLLLQDPDDDLRGFLCQELWAYGRPEAVPLLVDTLQNDPDATNRTWAAWGLGNIGDPAAVPALGLAMRSDLGEDYKGRPVKKSLRKRFVGSHTRKRQALHRCRGFRCRTCLRFITNRRRNAAKEAAVSSRVAALGGWLDYREEATEVTSICLTYEFDDPEKAIQAAELLRQLGEHVEGPMDYAA